MTKYQPVEYSEEEVMRAFDRRLDDWRELASELEQIKWDLFSDPHSGSEPHGLAVLICARLNNELRCVILLSERGYALEAASVCASMSELAHMLGHIGDDAVLTSEWAEYDEDHFFLEPKKAIKGSALKGGGDLSDAKKEHAHYKLLCTLKHGHPRAFRAYGFEKEDGGVSVFHGPYASPAVLYLSRTMLWYACRYMWLGLTIYHHYHTPDALSDVRERQLDQSFEKMKRMHDADFTQYEPS
jgi:hypothetical protein